MRILMTVICLLLTALPVQAAELLGTVTRLQGEAAALRGDAYEPLAVGATLMADDTVITSPDGRVQAQLTDGSELTLGGDAHVVLRDVVVPGPASDDGPFMELLTGAFRLVAASVADKGVEARRVRTPVATIGIRGTDFWGGALDFPLDVLVLEGAVEVTTTAGSVLLDAPGEGTHVGGPDVPPGPPGVWSDRMVSRAVATISFREE